MENPLECAKVAKTQQQDNTTLHNTAQHKKKGHNFGNLRVFYLLLTTDYCAFTIV